MPETALPTIHAIYATTSGNTEFVVDTVSEIWNNHGFLVKSHRAERTPVDVIANNQLFLFATSTWDHGTINPFFVPLYEAMANVSCAGKSAFFIGMGDNRYEPVLFNMGIQHILDRWIKQGGKELYHPLKINGEPHSFMTQLILPWGEGSAQELAKLQSGEQLQTAAASPATIPSSLTRDATAVQEAA